MNILFLRVARRHHCYTVPQITNMTHRYPSMILLFRRVARAARHHCYTVPQITNMTHRYPSMILLFLRVTKGHHCDTVPQISNVLCTCMYGALTNLIRCIVSVGRWSRLKSCMHIDVPHFSMRNGTERSAKVPFRSAN